MGNSHGKQREPLKPFQALKSSVVTTKPTTIRTELTDIDDTLRFEDSTTGETVFTIETRDEGRYRTLLTSYGTALVTLGYSSDAKGFYAFAGEDTNAKPVLLIKARFVEGPPNLFHCDFTDLVSGQVIRVLTEGDVGQRNVTVYLNRGPILPELKLANNERIKTYRAIGEIRRPIPDGDPRKVPSFGCIDAVPGVDISLLAMIWITRYELYVRTRKAAGDKTRMLMFVGAFAGASSC